MSAPLLASCTTLGVGGPARELVDADDPAALVDLVRSADRAGEPLLVLGGGSNVLVGDDGFDGLVVRVATRGVRVVRDPGSGSVLVQAAAGEPWDDLVAACVADGLAGVEALSGIPGLVGATPVQNVGAYGQDVAGTLVGVTALDRRTGGLVALDAAGCGFGYRDSVFKRRPGRHVVLSATFALARGPSSAPVRYAELAAALGVQVGARAPLDAVRGAVLALRRAKGMVLDPADPDTRSAGSFFTNPVLPAAAVPAGAPAWPQPDGRVKTGAAWLIEHAGFCRGWSLGPAASLSTKHALALTNRGGATAADVLALARAVRDGVRDAFGVELRPEPVLVGCAL